MKRRERERVRLQVLLGQVLLGQVRTERHRYSHTSTTFVRGISSVNKGRLRFFLSLCFALHIGFIHRETHIRSDTVYIRLFFNHNVYLYSPLQYILSHPETQITPTLLKKKKFTPTPFLNEAVQTQPPPPPPQERKELSLSLTQFLARENDTPPC